MIKLFLKISFRHGKNIILQGLSNFEDKPIDPYSPGVLLEISGQTSMKFGTLIAVTNTSIFMDSGRVDIHWFPWEPQFIRNEIPLFVIVYRQLSTFISMVPTCLSSSLCFSIYHVSLRYALSWERKH